MTIYVIIGDGGAGKQRIVGNYLSSRGIPKLVTYTSRKPKDRERDGVDFHFRTEEDILNMDLIEHTYYGEDIYGSREEDLGILRRNNPNIYTILDVKGAKVFQDKYGEDVVTIRVYCDTQTALQNMVQGGYGNKFIMSRLARTIEDRKTAEEINLHIDYYISTDNSMISEVAQYIDMILFQTMS